MGELNREQSFKFDYPSCPVNNIKVFIEHGKLWYNIPDDWSPKIKRKDFEACLTRMSETIMADLETQNEIINSYPAINSSQ
jgi:hypothetical protein